VQPIGRDYPRTQRQDISLTQANNSDNELVRRAIDGDIQAFELIYKRYAGFIQRVVYRVTTHSQDIEEIVQDVFVRVYRSLKGFKFNSSLKTWMYRIAVNTAINHQKSAYRHRKHLSSKPLEDHLPYIMDTGVKERFDQRQLIDAVLKEMPEHHRVILVLRHFEGLSYEEIAETLDLNLNTVRSRLSRAREKMLTVMKEMMSHDEG
jgi:RNA polymerase sigma-70 factor (ECF subfamily)